MISDPVIFDQIYQSFRSEAPELLRLIEQDLLSLMERWTIESVHSLMRHAHTLKGAAASVGRDTIKTVAHYLEDVFKALYDPDLKIDSELAALLWEGYECLSLPLTADLAGHPIDEAKILDQAAEVFAQLQTCLGDRFGQDTPILSSEDLGFDVIGSIFQESIRDDLNQLAVTLARQDPDQITEAFRSEAEFLEGLAESYALPGLGRIAQATLVALENYPDQVIEIAQIILANFEAAQAAVLEGDRTVGGEPSAALLAFQLDQAPNTSLDRTLSEQSPSEAILDPPLNLPFDATLEPTVDRATEVALDQTSDLTAEPILDPTLSVTLDPELDPSISSDHDPSANWPLSLIDSTVRSNEGSSSTVSEVDPQIFRKPDHSPSSLTSPSSAEESKDSKKTSRQDSKLSSQNQTGSGDFSSHQLALQTLLDLEAELKQGHLNLWNASPSSRTRASSDLFVIHEILENLCPHDQLAGSPTPPPPPAPVRSIRDSTSVGPSIRVDVKQLDQLHLILGELVINQSQQSLQTDQLHQAVRRLLQLWQTVQDQLLQLRDWSDLRFLPTYSGAHFGSSPRIHSNSGSKDPSVAFNFDVIEMDVYSELHQLLQTTLESITQLGEAAEAIEGFVHQSRLSLIKQKRFLTTAQDDLFQSRTVPISTVLNRFPRLLDQLAQSYRKPVHLILEGTDVLVDKTIAEKLADPLLHLVRNAFDHGIEPLDQRRQNGKPDLGQITIRAYHQGNRTLIEIEDDGRGLQWDRIRQKAVEQNHLSPAQAQELPETELANLLFLPGFSTTDRPSDLSGRGVGLDVVASQIQSLRGSIQIQSRPQLGTRFILQLPLTLTTARLLICQSEGISYALITGSIRQIVLPQPDQLQSHPNLNGQGSQRVLRWQRDSNLSLIPVQPLSGLLDYPYPPLRSSGSSTLNTFPLDQRQNAASGPKPLLLLEADSKLVALQVDRVLVEQELVIKSLGLRPHLPDYIQGYSVLGDSQLALVIDPQALIHHTQQLSSRPISTRSHFPELSSNETTRSKEEIAAAIQPQYSLEGSSASGSSKAQTSVASTSTILVIDDSITQRQSIALTLQKAGYSILQAGDGQEAIEILHHHAAVELVICDIEMPGVNGFEFLQACRHDPPLASITTVMLTSRTSAKHRETAFQLGAKDYLTKPCSEQELLQTAAKHLSKPIFSK